MTVTMDSIELEVRATERRQRVAALARAFGYETFDYVWDGAMRRMLAAGITEDHLYYDATVGEFASFVRSLRAALQRTVEKWES